MQPVADMPFTAQLFRCGGITQKDIEIDETVYFTCCPYSFTVLRAFSRASVK